MLRAAAYIAGDWGTSSARFWLCDEAGAVRDRRTGRGIAAFGDDAAAIAAYFSAVTIDWPEGIPAVLCGAVGSVTGWRDAGYGRCPAILAELGGGGATVEAGGHAVLLLPGLRTRNAFGEPDVMRGEETQLAGSLARLGPGSSLVVLPGTHTKWCLVADGVLESFHTGIPGELHAALTAHSVLVSEPGTAAVPGTLLEDGVALALAQDHVGLETLLFATRARQATGRLAAGEASDFLSGLLLGSDLATARRLLGTRFDALPLVLVSAAPLAGLYARALGQVGKGCSVLAGEDTVREGLHRAWRATAGKGRS